MMNADDAALTCLRRRGRRRFGPAEELGEHLQTERFGTVHRVQQIHR